MFRSEEPAMALKDFERIATLLSDLSRIMSRDQLVTLARIAGEAADARGHIAAEPRTISRD